MGSGWYRSPSARTRRWSASVSSASVARASGQSERLRRARRRRRDPRSADAGEGGARIGRDPAQQHRARRRPEHRRHGETVVGEHVLDRVVLVLAQAAEHDERGRRAASRQQQLGDDLVGAAEVEQLDVGEVEQGGEAVGAGQGGLDAVAGPRRRWGG